MLGSAFKNKSPARLDAVQRVQTWTRERLMLPEDAVISVAEIECRLPGCVPLETVVSYWEGEERYQFKVFKRLEEVAEEDMPYSWMKEATQVPEVWGCDCC